MRWLLLVLSCLLFALTGCGSGGGDGSISAATAAGLWSGTLTDGTNTDYAVDAVISTTGEIRIVNSSSGAQYAGQVSLNGSLGSGHFIGYASEGSVFPDGQPTTTGSLSFNLVEKTSISGTYSVPEDSGTFSLTYSPDLEGRSSVASLAGVWGYQNLADWVYLEVDAAGGITGTDDLGCIYLGRLSLPSREWKIFSLSLNVTQCGEFTGTYNGLAVPDGSDTMVYMFSNGTYSVVDSLYLDFM